jgi:tRNA threonylcarbamoyladenosine biosynthesis protein TsaE
VGASAALPLANRRATVRLARKLASALAGGDLLVLTGNLGAGKTFFTRALCRALGVPTTERVTSPTFTLVHEHEGRMPVRHVDAYRLRGAAELVQLGLVEQRSNGALLVVEWGEPYVGDLGGDALILRLDVSPSGARSATWTSTGPRGEQLSRACLAP